MQALLRPDSYVNILSPTFIKRAIYSNGTLGILLTWENHRFCFPNWASLAEVDSPSLNNVLTSLEEA